MQGTSLLQERQVFGRRVTLFELFSFKIRVDLSWLVLAALITWGLAVGYFPAFAPGLGATAYWVMGVVGFLGLAVSIVAHELAHALVARRYGMSIRGITLFLFGGVAEMDEEPSSPRGEALMAIAGPVMSLVIAVVCFAAAALMMEASAVVAPVLSYLAFINGLLVAFNLVPAFPLDGGRVLRALLWGWRGDIDWATRVAGRMGAWLGLLLMAGGLYFLLTGSLIGGVWWMLIGFFVRAAARGAIFQQQQRSRFRGARVRRFAEPHPVTVAPELPLDRLYEEYFEAYWLTAFPVVSNTGHLLGQVQLPQLRAVPRDRWSLLSVADLVQPCPTELLVEADAEAAMALGRMRMAGRRQLLVTEDGRLVGMVRLTSLQNYLAIRSGLAGTASAANDDQAAQARIRARRSSSP